MALMRNKFLETESRSGTEWLVFPFWLVMHHVCFTSVLPVKLWKGWSNAAAAHILWSHDTEDVHDVTPPVSAPQDVALSSWLSIGFKSQSVPVCSDLLSYPWCDESAQPYFCKWFSWISPKEAGWGWHCYYCWWCWEPKPHLLTDLITHYEK